MKKFTAILAIMLVVALVGVMFIGCKDKVPQNVEQRPFYEEGFGSTAGLTPTQALSGDMSAVEMLEAGVANYYGANYVASVSEGTILTEVIGIKLTQFVQSLTIREGSANGDYRQFSDNQSGSIKDDSSLPIDILIWEETGYTKSGSTETISFHSGNKSDMGAGSVTREKKDGTTESAYAMYFKEGKTFQATEKFDNLQAYSDAKAANPTKIWMYDLNGNTVIADQCTTPVKNDNGDWTFSIVGDPDKSTTEYQKQMMYMLNGQIPGDMLQKFAFTTIKLNVVMSENGFIKQVDIEESYDMQLKVLFFTPKVTITLKSTRYISYQNNETGMTSADLDTYMNRF